MTLDVQNHNGTAPPVRSTLGEEIRLVGHHWSIAKKFRCNDMPCDCNRRCGPMSDENDKRFVEDVPYVSMFLETKSIKVHMDRLQDDQK